NLNCAVLVGERSHCAMNCPGVIPFSCVQIAERFGAPLSSTLPNTFTAAWFARMMFPPLSTSIASQPAFSSMKTTSDFIAIFHFRGLRIQHCHSTEYSGAAKKLKIVLDRADWLPSAGLPGA